MDRQNWVTDQGEFSDWSPSAQLEVTLDEHSDAVSEPRQKLALTAEDLEEAFAIAHLGVWRWEVGTEHFHWSRELFRIAGRDPRTFTPTLASTLASIHPDDRDIIRGRLNEATVSYLPDGRTLRVVRPDGTERYCWARISPISEDGRVVAIRGVLLDVTERREHELALEASEQHYRDTIELSPQMPWTADPQGKILTVSGRWSDLTGLPEAAALGTGWLDQILAEDRAIVGDAVRHALTRGEPLDIKARLRCKDGDLRWIRVRAAPKIDAESGQILRWYGLTEDIHEQELAIASLRESEENYRYTVELNPQVPWTADPKGKILEAGPRWPEMVGTLPQGWISVLHPDDVAPTLERWNESLRTGDPIDVRYRLRQMDGSYKWARSRAGARRGPSGEILRWYGVLEDIDEQVKAEAALRAQEEWIRQAHEAAGIGLFEVDFDGGFSKLSAQSLVLHGLPADTNPIFPGESWADLVRPEDGPRTWAAVAEAMASGGLYDETFGVPLPDGRMRWINGMGRVEYHADGRPKRLLGINFDVSARRAAEAALENSEALNRSIVDASPDGIKLLSTSGEVLFANEACRPALEIGSDFRLTGRNWIDLWPATVRPRVREAMALAIAGKSGRFIAPRATARGRPKWWDVVVEPVLADGIAPHRLVTIARDITEQKTAEDRIHWSATHDPLTQLPNRRLFDQRLAEALSEAEAAGEGLTVFVLDLDQFKQINDTLGHGAGDSVLRTLGDRLRATARPGDMVARLGGDEFAVILPGVADAMHARELADVIRARLRDPVTHAGVGLDCSASIGASIYPLHGVTTEDLLKHADMALYSSKSKRRGEMLIFDPTMRAELQQRISMTNLARDALQDQRIRAYYQPKVDLSTGRVVGFEALARWLDLRGNTHLPGSIAAAFEDWDVSTALTDRMLKEVISQMRDWLDRGVDFGHVALNASAADFQRPDFGEMILKSLDGAGIPTRYFQIEITETVFLARAADVVEHTLGILSEAGVTIALDDFGTGYASLSHLKQFPVDVIKIDRSFVSDVGDSHEPAAIAEAVITLGRNLGIDVVAEGIETEAQAARLAALGCHVGQGFLYSKAVPAAAVDALAARRFDAQPFKA